MSEIQGTQKFDAQTMSDRYGPAVTAGPSNSDSHRSGDREGIFEFDADLTHRAVHLRVAKEALHRPQFAGLLAYLRDLRGPHGMGAKYARLMADGCHPVSDEASILARRDSPPLMEGDRAIPSGCWVAAKRILPCTAKCTVCRL